MKEQLIVVDKNELRNEAHGTPISIKLDYWSVVRHNCGGIEESAERTQSNTFLLRFKYQSWLSHIYEIGGIKPTITQ